MAQTNPPLIVGAGPVGLAAALLLTQAGRTPRLVEMRPDPSMLSRALAVNPRTLDLLEPSGVTARMLELGSPMRGVRLSRGDRTIAEITFEGIHPRYPFMLALSQATTERLLTQALVAAGGRIERPVRLTGCRTDAGTVEATIRDERTSTTETSRHPWVLAADGAHSAVRESMGMGFPGTAFTDDWHLADVPLRTDLDPDRGHVRFLDDGAFVFLIRVVDDQLHAPEGALLWRIITNRPDPVSQVIGAEPAGPPIWESRFRIAHRIASTFASGDVYLAGDAAHIHSPIGARGMNLGIEDAWIFTQLALRHRLAEYAALRRPVDQSVVRRVELFSKAVAAESGMLRFAREHLLPIALGIAPIRRRFMAMATGLDHPLPASLDPPRNHTL